MTYFHCLAAIIAFAALYLWVGWAGKRGANPHGLSLVVFAVGLMLSGADYFSGNVGQPPDALVVLGLATGAAAGIGMIGTTLAARSGITSTLINTIASLAIAVPVVLSFIALAERPSPLVCTGIVAACASMILIQGGKR